MVVVVIKVFSDDFIFCGTAVSVDGSMEDN